MLNKEIYIEPPLNRKLENQGVASVNDDAHDVDALRVLRYELKTFVCDGQYEKGIQDILDTYLKNINKPQQPGVWVSGFYGSGKSHLVKMLRALWINTPFPDGASAREIAQLPEAIKDQLVDLSTAGKREGGLHAASGTLGAGAEGSVRLALLQVVFKSVGLPRLFPVAKFVMWLRDEGVLDEVKSHVETNGGDWEEELDNFYVAEMLHAALVEMKPNLFSSTQICVDTLNNMFPSVNDVSSNEMIKAIRSALTRNGKFPLTLIVLDEVQQFIGTDADRGYSVAEVAEACCKECGGKLMIVSTGQTAVTGTANLKRLEGRFTTRIELSDADVEAVIRKVILAKRAEMIPEIEALLEQNAGEISRQLQGTRLAERPEDKDVIAADYPILPVRRRFWEEALRVLDQTGTDSQLRNQLSLSHKVIQTNLDEKVPHVIEADYLYFDSADKLLQARILPRKVYEKTMSWNKGSSGQQLMARACGLIFLINKLAASNEELGIKATNDTIADLMVQDLAAGSGELRTKLSEALKDCELLMMVGDEYRIQTEEAAAWTDEFLSQRSQIANATHQLESERDDRIRARFGELVTKKNMSHGNSKAARTLFSCFDSKLPSDADKRVTVWIRDGWSVDFNSVSVDARQAGNSAPTIFVFMPKRSADDLRRHLIDYKAAKATLDKRGVPSTPEGTEARSSMETTKSQAEEKINQLLDDSFHGARVLQSGGGEVLGNNLQEMILEAADSSLARLYPSFSIGDALGWEKVYKQAKTGAADALKAVGHEGEADKHGVCKAIIGQIAAGKKGSDLRTHFEDAPYGWDRDCIDGAIQVLLVSGIIRAHDERGAVVDSRDLERKAIGKVTFKIESHTITVPQRIQIRKLLQLAAVPVTTNEELASIPSFIEKLTLLVESAGGEPPKPEMPAKSLIDEIRLASGNEQLLVVFNNRDGLKSLIETCEATAKKITARFPVWEQLQGLLMHAGTLKAAEEARQQVAAICKDRLLLNTPDLVVPLLQTIEQTLRQELRDQHAEYCKNLDAGRAALAADACWTQLSEEQQAEISRACDIESIDALKIDTQEALVDALRDYPITSWIDRIDALSGRFARAREMAAKELEPTTQAVEVPRRTLKTGSDVDSWLEETGKILKKAVEKGPVIIQ